MTRLEPVQGCHAKQVRYQVSRDDEPTVMADSTEVKAAVTVITVAFLDHRECAQLLMKLAREITQQP